MKKSVLILGAFALIMALSACGGISIELGGSETKPPTSAPQSAAPAAFIDSPAGGSSLPMASIEINYRATSTAGVAAVELSIDGQVVNTYALPDPKQQVVVLKYAWQPLVSGSHTIRARAQGANGSWGDYAVTTVSIQEPPAQPTQPPPPPTAVPPTSVPPTAVSSEPQIIEVTRSVPRFYTASNTCGPMEVTITARVSQPDKVWSLVLFTRMADQESSSLASWDSGQAMHSLGNGVYSFKLVWNKVQNYTSFDRATLRYQFVGTDKNRNNVLRSQVYYDLELWECK